MNGGQAGCKNDGARRPGWSELDNPHALIRSDINVGVKSDLFHVKSLRAVNIRNRDGHQFKFHLHSS
jgi:hypothetical protein